MKPAILVVDDDEGMRLMVRNALLRLGHQVHEVRDGRAALHFLNKTPVHLLITDLLMPDCEGVELILQLRRNYPELQIIAMSGGGRVKARNYLELARASGAHAILEKPFPLAELYGTIARLLPSAPGVA